MDKRVIIGAGQDGESTALILAQKDLCKDLILINIKEKYAQGAAVDLMESTPLAQFDTQITASADMTVLEITNLVSPLPVFHENQACHDRTY